MPTIEVLVAPDGATRMETRGFGGADCQSATRALEAALGLTRHELLTAEFHAPLSQNSTADEIADTIGL